MSRLPQPRHRHFIQSAESTIENFESPRAKVSRTEIPALQRNIHGTALLAKLNTLHSLYDPVRVEASQYQWENGIGIQVEFESFPDVRLAFESLGHDRMGIELLNTRLDGSKTFATVYVPDGKLVHFEHLIEDYLSFKVDSIGRSRDHRELVDAIEQIRNATLEALWTDIPATFPTEESDAIWWEVWLALRSNNAKTLSDFRQLALVHGIKCSAGAIHFPERTVLLAYGSPSQLKSSILILNSIAELRLAKDTAEFFDSLSPPEQTEWLNDLLRRSTFSPPGSNVPHICVLDTGVNDGHPILTKAIAPPDLHTIEPEWGVHDQNGHGTEMSGLALTGGLEGCLATTRPVVIPHRLESVKLLPHSGSNGDNAEHHGYLTMEAISRPEVTAATRKRVFCLAVTASDNRDRGRPSGWSASIDSLAADSENDGLTPRLIVVSAGNVDPNGFSDYPHSNATDGIHDPGQAWNALTVGAYTDLAEITEPNSSAYKAIAPIGGLSPFSTTSVTWQDQWPLKPDVLFEGGNVAQDRVGPPCSTHSLSLLTTYRSPSERAFTTTQATSAATALASHMAARIMQEYPDLWPETVRGLIVHSARWNPTMKTQFLSGPSDPSKADVRNLIRHCGFGVPNLERALWSVSNSLSYVEQATLQPFHRVGSDHPKSHSMQLHSLPWPKEELEALGELNVKMRVTLSYFIQPNPSARGFGSRYRYESHGLRFEVKRPSESIDEFRARINVAARDEETDLSNAGFDSGWFVGKKLRHKGSIHCDIWQGTAAELASRGVLAVYPSLGWWKTRQGLEMYNSEARYSLMISILARDCALDLRTAVANQIKVPVVVST